MKKYLFLCAVGQNRSPTAARVAKEIAREKDLELEASYGGYDFLEENKVSREHFDNYDLIVVMEDYMKKGLIELGIQKKKIRNLEIPDEYNRNDPVLVNILRNSLPFYVREEPL